jgi:hypothetical protein
MLRSDEVVDRIELVGALEAGQRRLPGSVASACHLEPRFIADLDDSPELGLVVGLDVVDDLEEPVRSEVRAVARAARPDRGSIVDRPGR